MTTELIKTIAELKSHIPKKEIKVIKGLKNAASLHHSLGRYLRNEWGLWRNDTPLTQWFQSMGIFHGDDRSAIILDALILQINDKEITQEWIDSQVKFYKDYWKKMKARAEINKNMMILIDKSGEVSIVDEEKNND